MRRNGKNSWAASGKDNVTTSHRFAFQGSRDGLSNPYIRRMIPMTGCPASLRRTVP